MVTHIITLTAEEEETAKKLCDSGIGKSIEGESNLTTTELIQWQTQTYLRNKFNMFLDRDRDLLTREQVDDALAEVEK